MSLGRHELEKSFDFDAGGIFGVLIGTFDPQAVHGEIPADPAGHLHCAGIAPSRLEYLPLPRWLAHLFLGMYNSTMSVAGNFLNSWLVLPGEAEVVEGEYQSICASAMTNLLWAQAIVLEGGGLVWL